MKIECGFEKPGNEGGTYCGICAHVGNDLWLCINPNECFAHAPDHPGEINYFYRELVESDFVPDEMKERAKQEKLRYLLKEN